MSAWSKIKSAASTSKTVAHNAKKVSDTAIGLKNEAKDIHNNGITDYAKRKLSKKARRKMGKAALTAAKGLIHFLITPIAGWVVSGIIILLIVMGTNASAKTETKLDANTGTDQLTEEQYAAIIPAGCPSDSTGSVSGSVSLGNAKGSWSLADVTKFSKFSYASTFGVSDSKAANFFLTRNKAVAAKYGLNKNNIGKVSAAVKKVGVSPTFFFLYAVNESGGAGGFINHYTADNMTGNAVTDAKIDAEYIVSQSNVMSNTPASGGGEPENMPLKPASEFLSEMPAGSIGRVYTQATSATTAEIVTLKGHKGSWSGKFGNTLQSSMTYINQLGGNWKAGMKAFATGPNGGAGGVLSDADQKCADEESTLKSGGFDSVDEAFTFMKEKYFNVKLDMSKYNAAPGTPEIHDNCTLFSNFFVDKYTSLNYGGGNGVDVVNNMETANKGKKLKISHTPTPYAIFSIPIGTEGLSTGVEGHTGVVLGVNTDKKTMIIGQAGYGTAFGRWVAMEIPLSHVNSKWQFLETTDYLTGLD